MSTRRTATREVGKGHAHSTAANFVRFTVRLLVDLVSNRDREQAELQAEVLALRHQLRALQA